MCYVKVLFLLATNLFIDNFQIRADRYEDQEIVLDESAKNILQLNNGTQIEAKIEKKKFKLPFVFPKDDKDLIPKRIKEGLEAEKAFRNSEKFEGTEESAETSAINFKGKIIISKHVELGNLPKPEPEVIEKVPQPILKRRHPFFGSADPPTPVEHSSPSKNTRKRKKRI